MNSSVVQSGRKIGNFSDVDSTGEVEFFISFLDQANAVPSTQTAKRKMEQAMRLSPGKTVLEVGAGTGDDAIVLLKLVSPGGTVTAIDSSAAMIEETRRRAEAAGVQLDLRVADVQHLPFAGLSFDAVRAERVLMHVPDAESAIAETIRVTKPNGRVVILDFDWDAVIFQSRLPMLSRRLMDYYRSTIRNPYLGRDFMRLFHKHGLTEVEVVPHGLITPFPLFRRVFGGTVSAAASAGVITAAEAETWWADLEALAEEGSYYTAFPGFIAAGTKRSA